MTAHQIVQLSKESFENIQPRQQAVVIMAEYRALYLCNREKRELTDDFYLWYFTRYLNPEPLISTTYLPREKDGPFRSLESQPVLEDSDEGACMVCEEHEAQFWSVYVRMMDGCASCLADCATKELAMALEAQVLAQLRVIKSTATVQPGFPCSASELLAATALSLYAMRKVN